LDCQNFTPDQALEKHIISKKLYKKLKNKKLLIKTEKKYTSFFKECKIKKERTIQKAYVDNIEIFSRDYTKYHFYYSDYNLFKKVEDGVELRECYNFFKKACKKEDLCILDINSIIINQNFRGLGQGKLLVKQTLNEKADGYCILPVWLDENNQYSTVGVNKENLASFYEKIIKEMNMKFVDVVSFLMSYLFIKE